LTGTASDSKLVSAFLFALLALLIGFTPGCPPASPSLSPSPVPPFIIEASFPNGAPPLNQTGQLRCVVKSNYPPLTIPRLEVGLPEGMELISGALTWSGSVLAKEQVTAIDAVVKSIKVGNWTVAVNVYLGWIGTVENIGHPDIYVSISENSAQWRAYPPYPNTYPTRPGDITVAPPNSSGTLPPPPPPTAKPSVGQSNSRPTSQLTISLSIDQADI